MPSLPALRTAAEFAPILQGLGVVARYYASLLGHLASHGQDHVVGVVVRELGGRVLDSVRKSDSLRCYRSQTEPDIGVKKRPRIHASLSASRPLVIPQTRSSNPRSGRYTPTSEWKELRESLSLRESGAKGVLLPCHVLLQPWHDFVAIMS